MRIDASTQHLGTTANPRPITGLIWTLISSATYGLIFIFPNLWGEGLGPWQLTWFRFLGGLLTLLPLGIYFAATGQRARIIPNPKLIGWHALRAAFGVATFFCSITAILFIDQANASAITQISGVFTVSLAMIFLGERPSARVLGAGVIALAGAIICAEPNIAQGQQFLSIGALAAFGAAFFLGVQFTILKFITDKESSFVLVFAMSFFGSIYCAPMAIMTWEPVNWGPLLAFLSMGLLANFGQLANVLAFRFASASFIAPAKYSNIVFTTLWAFFLLGQVPSLVFWGGAALITVGGLLLIRARKS